MYLRQNTIFKNKVINKRGLISHPVISLTTFHRNPSLVTKLFDMTIKLHTATWH